MQVLTPEQAKLGGWSAFDEVAKCSASQRSRFWLLGESPKVVQGPPAYIGRSQGFTLHSLRRTGLKTPQTSSAINAKLDLNHNCRRYTKKSGSSALTVISAFLFHQQNRRGNLYLFPANCDK